MPFVPTDYPPSSASSRPATTACRTSGQRASGNVAMRAPSSKRAIARIHSARSVQRTAIPSRSSRTTSHGSPRMVVVHGTTTICERVATTSGRPRTTAGNPRTSPARNSPSSEGGGREARFHRSHFSRQLWERSQERRVRRTTHGLWNRPRIVEVARQAHVRSRPALISDPRLLFVSTVSAL